MTDPFTVRMIVAFMGVNATLIILGGIWLANVEKSLTDALIALGGVALGNLGTFLVSSRHAGEPARDVADEPTPDAPGPPPLQIPPSSPAIKNTPGI